MTLTGLANFALIQLLASKGDCGTDVASSWQFWADRTGRRSTDCKLKLWSASPPVKWPASSSEVDGPHLHQASQSDSSTRAVTTKQHLPPAQLHNISIAESRYPLVSKLLVPPPQKVQLGACVIVVDEGRWLDEWLVYHRMAGVEKFWIYGESLLHLGDAKLMEDLDTGSRDSTFEVLQPWVDAGVVQLHEFKEGAPASLNQLSCSH